MYLIVGANGFLGRYLIKNILEMTEEYIIAADVVIDERGNTNRVQWLKCDITEHLNIIALNNKLKEHKNIKAIFLAAYHNPDNVIKYPKIAWQVNITALADFIGTMDNIESFYYPSTEVVYGNGEERFKETDPLNPANHYGEIKTVAEKMVIVSSFNIVRLAVLIGPSLVPNKKSFYENIVSTLSRGEKMEFFDDQFRTFIDFDSASKCLIELMQNKKARKHKIVNIAGDEEMSKYQLAMKISQAHKLDESLAAPISLSGKQSIFTEKRANKTLLDNSLLKQILGLKELKMNI